MDRRLDGAVGGVAVPPEGGPLARISRGVMVAGAGSIRAAFAGDAETPPGVLTVPALQPGVIYPLQVTEVLAGPETTATGIVVLW